MIEVICTMGRPDILEGELYCFDENTISPSDAGSGVIGAKIYDLSQVTIRWCELSCFMATNFNDVLNKVERLITQYNELVDVLTDLKEFVKHNRKISNPYVNFQIPSASIGYRLELTDELAEVLINTISKDIENMYTKITGLQEILVPANALKLNGIRRK